MCEMVAVMTVMFDKLIPADGEAGDMFAQVAANTAASPRFAAIDGALLDQLHRSADQHRISVFSKMQRRDVTGSSSALFCGIGQPATAGMVALCRATRTQVDICETLDDLQSQLAHLTTAPSFVAIDLVAIGGLEQNFDKLRALRLQFRSLPLLLISEDFQHHDFSTERLGLADAWIHAARDLTDLKVILTRATENNARWANRLH
jgi:hypothetical protein